MEATQVALVLMSMESGKRVGTIIFGIRPALFQGRNSGSGADFSSPLPLLLGYVMLLSYESI